MQAPIFTLKELHSNQTISLSDYKGKVILLNFWVSWCPDCMRELPQIHQLYKTMQSDDVVILTINVTGREGRSENGIEFVNKHQLSFPVLIDEGTETYDLYQCTSVPTTFLIDSNGEITNRYNDTAQFQDILFGLSALL